MKPCCNNASMLLGRVFLSTMFIAAGIFKLMHFDATVVLMAAAAMPYANILLIAVIIIEFIGGLMLLVGYKTRFAAMVLFLFIVLVTIFWHDFWFFQGDVMPVMFHMLMKNKKQLIQTSKQSIRKLQRDISDRCNIYYF